MCPHPEWRPNAWPGRPENEATQTGMAPAVHACRSELRLEPCSNSPAVTALGARATLTGFEPVLPP
jgi:hypothetical protein